MALKQSTKVSNFGRSRKQKRRAEVAPVPVGDVSVNEAVSQRLEVPVLDNQTHSRLLGMLRHAK